MERRTFHTMGTEIELLVDAKDATEALSAAEAEFRRLEAILSRFRADSELSRLNRAGRLDAGPDLLRVTELALAARDQTAGRFDPTVHDAVVAAGYDRTFESIAPDGPDADENAPRLCGGLVRVRRERIELEDGVHLDFGGIGKGYAADRAAEVLATAGPCLVNAGGDIAVRAGAWPVAVQTADGSLTLELTRGALATSGRDRRRWRRGGRELHHLIDPATARPAGGDLVRATVVASDAVTAEVWAKALFLAGGEAGAAEADVLRLPSVFVLTDGSTRLAGGLA
jgi:thiamine biosynthesis lipoprotein